MADKLLIVFMGVCFDSIGVVFFTVTIPDLFLLKLVLKHYINYHECSPTLNVYLLIGVCNDHYYNEADYFAGTFISSYLGIDSLSIYWDSLSLISILSLWRSIALSVHFCW